MDYILYYKHNVIQVTGESSRLSAVFLDKISAVLLIWKMNFKAENNWKTLKTIILASIH
jgi:hypothetical protein